MDKQIIEISNDGFLLSIFRGFIVIENKDQNIKKEVPLDNVLSLVLSANNVVLSKNIINAICENGGNIICCGNNYLPTSIILPYVGHWLVSPHIKQQLDISLPLQKNLWQSIIRNKILNQAKVLEHIFPDSENIEKLKRLSKETLSNDARNNEGQAARIYFKSLFGKKFIRDRMSADINILLNYTYTVLRAMVARAITGNGLLPYLGIKHCTRSNPIPLVDDLIEPFRAIADIVVFSEVNRLVDIDSIELTPEIKRNLTKIISYPVMTNKGRVSLCDGLYDFVGSIVKSFEAKKVQVEYPEITFGEE